MTYDLENKIDSERGILDKAYDTIKEVGRQATTYTTIAAMLAAGAVAPTAAYAKEKYDGRISTAELRKSIPSDLTGAPDKAMVYELDEQQIQNLIYVLQRQDLIVNDISNTDKKSRLTGPVKTLEGFFQGGSMKSGKKLTVKLGIVYKHGQRARDYARVEFDGGNDPVAPYHNMRNFWKTVRVTGFKWFDEFLEKAREYEDNCVDQGITVDGTKPASLPRKPIDIRARYLAKIVALKAKQKPKEQVQKVTHKPKPKPPKNGRKKKKVWPWLLVAGIAAALSGGGGSGSSDGGSGSSGTIGGTNPTN